ncbi:amidohydrolase family protein [Chitinophaga qingshengii]|uniref:Amidohydrolase family protein n=1 Tax=Chitinophaga qingshengii TaxID=1569794 RepID=A0ABR7TQX5_9BACT|nr:amidohydrolase family protein [Chitinophaga qingshengii]MBC9932886.1 amidohydrolase family protein [Chitinophaga qingshengii]
MKKIFWIAVLLACVSQVVAQRGRTLLLKNATIIDGEASVAPRKGAVLIRDGKIVEVVYGSAPAADSVINCTGKFITPGLMDAHVHLATMNMDHQRAAEQTTDSILLNMFRHGITSVRDMAGDAIFLAGYSRLAATGQLPAPDIFYAAQFAGPGYFKLLGGGSRSSADLGTTPWYCAISPETDLRLAIASAKGAGVTGIKVYADLSRQQIADITKEAHQQGIQVWSHGSVFPAKPADAVAAGVNSLSHANDLCFQQLPGDTLAISSAWQKLYKGFVLDTNVQITLLKQMKEKGIFLDPTVFHAGNNKMENAFTITRLAHRLGVAVVAGTDWIYPAKNEQVPLMEEMKLLVSRGGMSPAEALQCATLNGALVTGLKDRGVIRAGKKADLLILDNDPLKDISRLFAPEMVIKHGRVSVVAN